jgi:hypothetical protein
MMLLSDFVFRQKANSLTSYNITVIKPVFKVTADNKNDFFVKIVKQELFFYA